MQYNLVNKGYLKTNDKRIGHSNILERVYEINGIDCIELNGNITSNGAEAWFYKISDFTIKNDIIKIPEFLPPPEFKIKHRNIISKDFNKSINKEQEKIYKQ